MKYAQTREELLLSLIHRKEPRAVNDRGGACTYRHSHYGGCAIGCQVRPSTARRLESPGGPINTSGLHLILPKRMQMMGKSFLRDIQKIHDDSSGWVGSVEGEKGPDGLVWNSHGKKKINGLIKRYELDVELLKIPGA